MLVAAKKLLPAMEYNLTVKKKRQKNKKVKRKMSKRSALHIRPEVSGVLKLVSGKQGMFLFEVFVTPSDVELDRLQIPVEAALDYFPSFANREVTYKERVVISDPGNSDWFMMLTYDPEECLFVIYSKYLWQRFVLSNNLESQDVIRFYKPVPLSHKKHYLVDIVKRRRPDIIHEFKPENFLFEQPLTKLDILFQRLFMTKEGVSHHFPAVGLPAETHHTERLFLTDGVNKLWIISIKYYEELFRLLLHRYIAEHNLEEGDMLRFYKPVHPLHSRHFLIDFVKRGNDSTQSATIALNGSTSEGGNREGDGGGGSDSGGSTQGDGGEGSRSGGRKCWKSNFGGCKRARKSKGRTEEP